MGLPWRYAIGCIDNLDLILRAEVIWSKPNGLPESVTDRVRRSHEQWFHFTKEPRYFAAVDEVRQQYSERVQERQRYAGRDVPPSKGYAPANRNDPENARGILGFGHNGANPLGSLPGSVWEIPSEPLKVPEHIGVDHFAAFPQEWPRRIILGWSPSGVCTVCGEGRRPVVDAVPVKSPVHGDGSITGNRNGGPDERRWDGSPRFNMERNVTGYACTCPDTSAPTKPAIVLDPFAGTGTVPMVARALGRYGIGIDLSGDYLRLAKWRVFESGHAAKTMRRTNLENQGSLL